MKHALRIASFFTLIGFNGFTYAINPIPGWYVGAFLGGTYMPKTNFNFIDPFSGLNTKGDMTYSALVDVGLQAGYRFQPYRLEGELVFSTNPYKTLKLGTVSINKSKKSNGIRMNGQTNVVAFMINGFYDLYTTDMNDGGSNNLVPYLGGGVGYASVQNSISFYNNNIEINGSHLSQNASSPAVQGILGLGYFIDDYTVFGLDLRYLTTKSIKPFDQRAQFVSLNLTFNAALDCG